MKKTTKGILCACKNLPVRFLFVFMFILSLTGGEAFAQTDKKVTIKVKGLPVRTALDKLQKITQMHFMYEEEAFSDKQKVTLEHENALLEVVLNDLTEQVSLRYEVKNDVILLFPRENSKPKRKGSEINISGRVCDEHGEELIGVNIMIAGTTKGVITDMDGKYEIKASPGEILLFSYIGMENKPVKVESGKRTVDVEMKTRQAALGEVIVTGYQTLSKERATGAYSIISEKNTKGKLETNILSRIEGLVAGMNKIDYAGNKHIIRGITSVMGATTPLYVVDGLPFEGSIASINPSEVQNITVLKDAAAASIYGAMSANGVIVITTKNGQAGTTKIAYSNSVKILPKPDLGYLNLVNSSELVDMQIEGFNFYHEKDYERLNKRISMNPVIDILYRHEKGEIADLEKALAYYRNSDNRKEIEKEFARTGLSQQHNLSVSGGTEVNQYLASLNYTKILSNQKNEYSDRIGFTLKNKTTLYKWLLADIGAAGSFSRSDNKNSSSYTNLILSNPSYYMLRDEDGTPLAWSRGKSDYELDRLISIGLMDETYSPITDQGTQQTRSNINYYRVHAGLTFKIAKGLSADLKYQTESNYDKTSGTYSAQSWYVKNMINNAAQYDATSRELTLNVPQGGQKSETRSDVYSYTFRAQMNFERTFGVHEINAIAGAERRLKRRTGTMVYYMGYDENGLVYTPYDPALLEVIRGTESLYSIFAWDPTHYNGESHTEDRYVSFYGNASYTYDKKYAVAGSIRVDKSDLYATDPKKQNRPLWSIGGNWHLAEEAFMQHIDWVNLLKLRMTYGIGGNIPKVVGPYMNISATGYNTWIGAMSSAISNPPNPMLRWEKTATTNVGVDFFLFNHRFGGSIDYYQKKTTNILGYKKLDPTLGRSSLLVNYGKMLNRGIETELQSVIIQNRKFNWQTNFVFSYNKNKLTNLEGSQESVFNYSAYDVTAVGYPLSSIFSYRYAGLDPKNGNVLVYNKEGEKVADVESVEDMVYSGTRVPKYMASLKNAFSYKNFDLSFMFMYYGGHVMRDVVASYQGGAPIVNVNRKNLTLWRNPGDEKIPGMAPSMNRNIDYTLAQTWYSADIHVKKADYIKLRDVSLSYNMPKKWLKRHNLENLMLTCQISNLWWWAKNGDIDPEAYTTTLFGSGVLKSPNPVTYTFGLSMNF